MAAFGDAANPWRTEVFARLNEPLSEILGDKTAAVFAKMGVNTVRELMSHIPYRYLAGTQTTDLSTVRPGSDVALVARVENIEQKAAGTSRPRLEALLSDGNETINLTFFGKQRLIDYWQTQLGQGVKGIFVGKVGVFKGQLQMAHPDFVMLDESGRIVGRATESRKAMAQQVSRSGLVGIYPATAKFPTWRVAECVHLVLDQIAGLADPLPVSVRRDAGLLGQLEAYEALHRPDVDAPIEQARRRLKMDEALALQVTMARRRKASANHRAAPIEERNDGILAAFDQCLPFELTAGQRRVGDEIFADLAKPIPMQRLLQGEVGSGKTIVALRTMLACVDMGRQAVLLAPTEVLASQHHESIRALLGEFGNGRTLDSPELATEVVLLTGSMSAAAKRRAVEKIADGEAGIIIGTHALLSATVRFAELGLVVVDEQHRFGVEQRAKLQSQSATNPHVLVMTATPIPRSIAMTVFGDLEVSTLAELPAGRAEVQTIVVATRTHPHWLERVWQRVCEEVAEGRQAFIVCSRINASEADFVPDNDSDWQPSVTVEELAVTLSGGPLRGLRIGVLHGRMASADKEQVMARFTSGEVDVLISTTVIEVGVDVPQASAMVVMDADRFGVSQLHQLRGRIGRGKHPGICLLVTNAHADSTAVRRLFAVANSRDGFELARLDLAQRREGNVLGANQSGSKSTLRLLRAIDDAEIIDQAREIAAAWVSHDDDDDPLLDDLSRQTEIASQTDWLEKN